MTDRIQKLNDQIAALEAKAAELREELVSLERIQNIAERDAVTFEIGRKDDKQLVTGVVLGVADTDAGKQLRVFVEAGFNSTTYTLKASQVVDVLRPQTAEAVEVAEQPAE
jgi:hypothetical protein